jgi:outer membrane protein OmpA-like peptidoglycan-associated protein
MNKEDKMNVLKPLVLITAMLLLLLFSGADEAKKDHPVIKPIPGFTLEDAGFENFSSYTFKQKENGDIVEKKVKGKYWFYYYEYKKGDRTFSKLEIIENHKEAALEKGGKILSETDTKLDFRIPLSKGGTIWTHLHTWENSYELYIIEEKGFIKRLTFSAEAMKKELDEKGHVSIYGIYFDFDKWTLKPGSEKVLLEIVKLMKNHSGLKLEIQGHTDSIGKKDYNKKLSEQRAKTVKSFLILYGIDENRTTIMGFGQEKPVASNETEEGRALNRRVELKKK